MICPQCKGEKMIEREQDDNWHSQLKHPRKPCERCNATGEVAYLKEEEK